MGGKANMEDCVFCKIGSGEIQGLRICEDDEKYVNFASGSLNRYKTLFSFETMIKKILTVYENLQ